MDLFCQSICDQLKKRFQNDTPVLSCLERFQLKRSDITGDFFATVPSDIYRERLVRILPQIKKEIASKNLKPFSLEIGVDKENSRLTIKPKSLQSPVVDKVRTPTTSVSFEPSGVFDKRHTFNSFVVGVSNSVAYEASRNVASKPSSHLYNPLFIHGSSGLGKTHLLHAIGQAVLKKNPSIQVRYLTAERFLHSCVSSIRNQAMDQFQEKYRYNTDVLLIDDIQSIEKGARSQEEFFHTFNSITERGGLVVCTCDCLPSDIKKLQNRLKTRLISGLVVQVDAPDLETNVNILKLKASEMKLPLCEEVILYLSKIPTSSTRELIGFLKTIKGNCNPRGISNPSLSFVKTLFEKKSSSLELETSFSSPQEVISCLSKKYNLSYEDLVAPNKKRSSFILNARNLAVCSVQKNFPHLPLQKIAHLFGLKSVKTVRNALKK